MTGLVYLAGPITGLTYDGAQDWRDAVTPRLFPAVGLSPLRGKEYLRQIGELSGHGEEYKHLGCLSTPRGVMTRDYFDATRCDVILANLGGAKSVSTGTVMEIAWGFQAKIPIVAVMEASGNPHEHMMINEAIGYRVETLDEAVHVVRMILNLGAEK